MTEWNPAPILTAEQASRLLDIIDANPAPLSASPIVPRQVVEIMRALGAGQWDRELHLLTSYAVTVQNREMARQGVAWSREHSPDVLAECQRQLDEAEQSAEQARQKMLRLYGQ